MEKELLLGRGQSSVGRVVAVMVILLILDKCFHFGVAILILNASPHFSLVFVTVSLLDIENASSRLLQLAEVSLEDVVCSASRSLLFSFHFRMVKRKYRFLSHDLLL